MSQKMTQYGDPVIEAAGTGGARIVGIQPSVVKIDPVSRVEGHLKMNVSLESVGGQLQVVDAWSTGTLFRGLEKVLVNRDPWDAVVITQRICGVCPISHAMASVLALDDVAGVTIPNNARVLRNLVLGANFIQSHILHFYILGLLDFMDGPDMAPWAPRWSADKRLDAAAEAQLLGHYLEALAMRRKAHEMGAVFGGRLPHAASFIPGGFTASVSSSRISQISAYLGELIPFISNVLLPDIELLASFYPDYFDIGGGRGNLLAFGVFDLNSSGTSKLLDRGRVVNGSTVVQAVNEAAIREQVTHSWYQNGTNDLHPSAGETEAQFPKLGAYSWLKAPRYSGAAYEAGPLARMWVNGDYREGISVLDRHRARAFEALKVAQAMQGWLGELQVGGQVFQQNSAPSSGTSFGLTEAPRGALGHWLEISSGKISNYQVVTPTCWNASPRDTAGTRGPIEEALIGTPVSDMAQPVEVLRVIHSFDPCLACAVHVMRADDETEVCVINPR